MPGTVRRVLSTLISAGLRLPVGFDDAAAPAAQVERRIDNPLAA